MSYRFHPAAEAEHLETIRFYDSCRRGLGADCLAEFDALMICVVERPTQFRLERRPDIRKAGLRRFPFELIFRAAAGQPPLLLAVSHKRRQPGWWRRRV